MRLCNLSISTARFCNKFQEMFQKITFLVMIVNSKTMTLSLSQKNNQNLQNNCLEIYQAQEITLLELTR